MKLTTTRGVVGAQLILVFLLSFLAFAQDQAKGLDPGLEPGKPHLGFPQDWSSRHLVMTGNSGEAALARGAAEPRHVYSLVQRMIASERRWPAPPERKKQIQVDWAVSLENGFVSANQFPAKYRFDFSSESCNGDYVIYALTVNSGTQANLVGINNLYTEASPKCNGGTPWVSFAYNTVTHAGGQNRTSPTLSGDGMKVAFVESTASGSFFHVLVLPNPIPVPPSQTGTVLAPQAPSSCATPTTASCMTTLQISGAANTLSSPWIDYGTDTAYVGTDDGKLYKINPVFGGGAPALINDTNWPVTVVTSGASNVLTDPVVDTRATRLFIGDGNGYLYAVSLTNPGKATAARLTIGWVGHGPGTGIVDPPIVVTDSANPAQDQIFSFTGCSNVVGIGGAVNQVAANFTSASAFTSVDLGSSDGAGNCTTRNVHAGTFDNRFWLNGTTTGHVIACGFVSGGGAPSTPKMYMFPFNASHLITATGSTSWVINNSAGDECSPLTEFFDGTTDRMFFGVGGTTDGFIESSVLTGSASAPNCTGLPTSSCVQAPTKLGGTSGIVVDNQLSNGGANIYFSTLAPGSVNGQKCNLSGGLANPYCAVKLTQSSLQ